MPDPQQLCDSSSYCETRYGSNSGSNQDNFRGADPVNSQRAVGGSDDDGSFTKDFPFEQGTKDIFWINKQELASIVKSLLIKVLIVCLFVCQ